jgi:hypothetical protein
VAVFCRKQTDGGDADDSAHHLHYHLLHSGIERHIVGAAQHPVILGTQ